MLADSGFIGVKAAGLFRLPREWISPFLVLTKSFSTLHARWQSFECAFSRLSKNEQELLRRFCNAEIRRHGNETAILVRSNASSEDISSRGHYQSYNSEPSVEKIAETVDAVLRQSPDQMCVLLQRGIEPGVVGHMSNERRVSADKRRWLIEGMLPHTAIQHRFVRAARSAKTSPLYASTPANVVTCLQRVAGFLITEGSGYYHCEWVWDGRTVWIVQADDAALHPESDEKCANPYLLAPKLITRRFKPVFQSLMHFRETAGQAWKKLQRPLLFDRLGLPTADVYLLPGKAIFSRGQSLTRIKSDLAQLCRTPVVVRCDIAESVKRADILLPTSPAFSNPDSLLSYLEGLDVFFRDLDIARSQWAALLANLVPARASAMVHAHPDSARIQVDALWGFPDGLNHLAHDTFFYYPADGHLRSHRRFKGHCVLPEGDGWQTLAVSAPLDWRAVLSRDEIKLVSDWALRVAKELNREVQLMALARIGGIRNAAGCLPWHYSIWEVPAYADSLEYLPSGVRTIAARDDLKRLDTDPPRENCRGFLLQPNPSLLRDSDFIKEVAQAAAKHSKPLYFYGSLLGHAYYIMAKTGAIVVPITEGEPPQDRRTYRKLVRDRIPIVIREAGALARVREVSASEATRLLAQKLIEESYEVWLAPESTVIEELADVLEVVDALRHQSGISLETLAEKREEKRLKRGGFDQLIFLEETNIQSLRAVDSEPGRLPLFGELLTSALGFGSRPRPIVKSERTVHGADLARFSVPLIPPIESGAISNAFSANIGDFRVQAQYVGNRLNVSFRRRQPLESPDQLLLFPDLVKNFPHDEPN
jgi:predicted house-cleaning noncanonical NTP pyrophosphatase (MazG superfamily)